MNHVSQASKAPASVAKLLHEAFPQPCHFKESPDRFLPMYQRAILEMEKQTVCPVETYRFCKQLTELIFQGPWITSMIHNQEHGIFSIKLELLDESEKVVRSIKTWNEVIASAILLMAETAEAYWDAVGDDDV